MRLRASWFACVVLAGLLALQLLVACDDDPPVDACLEPLESCDNPAVPPTFDSLYEHVFQSCGAANTMGSCHSAQGAKLGLILSDPDTAYDYLLGVADGRARVLPEDMWCSELLKRIESQDPQYRMPPSGTGLTDGLRCSVRQWIENGANRD